MCCRFVMGEVTFKRLWESNNYAKNTIVIFSYAAK